jgi:hypothetical protein
MQRFILIYTGSVSGEGFRLVGPFPSDSELSAWGQHWQLEHEDDPRWHVIDLPEFDGSIYPLPVTPPERPKSTDLEDRIDYLKSELKQLKEVRKVMRGHRGAELEGGTIARSA